VTLRLMPIAAGVLIAAFVWLHTGAPGDATCQRTRFVSSSSGFSAWPPGVRCEYGEPVRADVVINEWFAVVAGAVLIGLVVARGEPTGSA
jgi:hypothetical protein